MPNSPKQDKTKQKTPKTNKQSKTNKNTFDFQRFQNGGLMSGFEAWLAPQSARVSQQLGHSSMSGEGKA